MVKNNNERRIGPKISGLKQKSLLTSAREARFAEKKEVRDAIRTLHKMDGLKEKYNFLKQCEKKYGSRFTNLLNRYDRFLKYQRLKKEGNLESSKRKELLMKNPNYKKLYDSWNKKRSEITRLQTKVDEHFNSSSSFKQKLNDLTRKKEKLEKDIDYSERMADNLSRQSDPEYRDFKNSAEQGLEELSILENKIDKLKNDFGKVEKEKTRLLENLKTLKLQRNGLKKQLDAFEKDF